MAFSTVWSDAKLLPDGEAKLKEYIKAKASPAEKVHEQGKLSVESFVHTAQYYKPYIMHASTGPSCSVALWDKRHCIYGPTHRAYIR